MAFQCQLKHITEVIITAAPHYRVIGTETPIHNPIVSIGLLVVVHIPPLLIIRNPIIVDVVHIPEDEGGEDREGNRALDLGVQGGGEEGRESHPAPDLGAQEGGEGEQEGGEGVQEGGEEGEEDKEAVEEPAREIGKES